ncbi:MAG TPA: hypothetical protein VJ874_01815 [Candidatus Thermoplasmatota archaeon]|nr:hypothetical protein [Candidatus Thermoplasmatota archaeon]
MALSDYSGDLAQLGLYAVGIALYTLAVLALYVPMSTRMMFARRFGERRVATPARRFAYVLAFPLLSFAFFLLVAGSMVFLADFSEGSLTPPEAMTIAMAIVLAIRICAYFSEHAAQDLARVMPLGLLGVILVTNQFADLRDSLQNLKAFADDLTLLALFFLVVVVTEFVLRLVYEVLGRPGHGRDPRDPSPGLQKRPKD